MKGADMSEIKKCENCGNENIEIINRFKGHYSCGKCGRDTEKLYEIEHDAEIRAKAIEEFTEEAMKQFTDFDLKHGYPTVADCKIILREISEEMRGAI